MSTDVLEEREPGRVGGLSLVERSEWLDDDPSEAEDDAGVVDPRWSGIAVAPSVHEETEPAQLPFEAREDHPCNSVSPGMTLQKPGWMTRGSRCSVGTRYNWNRRSENVLVANGERNRHPRTRWKVESQRHRKRGGVALVAWAGEQPVPVRK